MMTTFQASSLMLDAAAVILIGAGIAAMIIVTMRRERENQRRFNVDQLARDRKREEALLELRTLIERTGGAQGEP